ncbi:hypothetical protein U1Q18_015352 [Sarracenia purpurea var. burkii]
MECNKDEAIRAREIAQKKMENDDFEGARKIAQKAQQLFPELDNIYQLLTVCDVHCSARKKICGSEMDWYGILQVERLADEVIIKKQYRKLALVLHPDKNKFPGAESAFKLIGEANMVLSDQGKRSLYDSKCRISMRTTATMPPPHQFNRNPSDRKQYIPTPPNPSNARQAFWTSCPFCNMRYQYYRDFVNRALRCQNCSKPFIAYDLGAQGVPPGPNFVKPPFPQQKLDENHGSFKVGSQNSGVPFPHTVSRGNFSSKTVASEPVSRSGNIANKVGGKPGFGSAKVDSVKPAESGTSRNTSMKRRRKVVMESSESCDTATSADTEDDVIVQENVGSPAGKNSELDGVRRSFRKRQHVSYKESLGDDDDFISPMKKSRTNASSGDSKEELKEEVSKNRVSKSDNSTGFAAAVDRDKKDVKGKGNAHLEGSYLNRNGKAAEHVVNREVVMADSNANASDVSDNAEDSPDPVYYECPDPEFNDFDKDRDDNCFAVDQIWACYDTLDGMPRFYARVRKVFASGFRLRITWLEPSPEDEVQYNWFSKGLPFACGKFIHGNSEDTMDRLTFSHQVHCEKGSSRSPYVIYPIKGETWALFKDWDMSWSSDPENHKNYKFEIVVVISDFVEDYGTRVAYLDKVEGFVSVFQQTTREGDASFLISPTDLLRFSHRVPSFKLVGTERDGIPEGSFELDPASLPTNFNDCGNMKMEAESLDVKDIGSNPKSSGKGVKSMKSAEKLNTPNKCVGFEGKNDFMPRRSPRELNNKDKRQNQMNASQSHNLEVTSEDLDVAKDKKHSDITLPNGDNSSSQGDEKLNLAMMGASPQSSEKIPSIPPFSPGGKTLEEFYDFNEDKCEGKFERGQIWALYGDDRLPKIYALVKKIASCPFLLHVAMLESCAMSEDRAHAVSCGTFKVITGKPRLFPRSSFSHVVKAESIRKNRFKIFPRGGEIWALYKDWNVEKSCSDLRNKKFEIVEVLENNEQCIKVSPLNRLSGFKSVFKAQRRERSSGGVREIPVVELARFSHQIPSFDLTHKKHGLLRGCWELDPASVPDF